MEGRKSKDKKEVCRRKEGERKYVEKSINKDKRKEGMKGTKSVATRRAEGRKKKSQFGSKEQRKEMKRREQQVTIQKRTEGTTMRERKEGRKAKKTEAEGKKEGGKHERKDMMTKGKKVVKREGTKEGRKAGKRRKDENRDLKYNKKRRHERNKLV